MLKKRVAMSRSSTPLPVIDARTRCIASAAPLRARATVSSVASTPTSNTPMSGVTVTLPVPLTEMPPSSPAAVSAAMSSVASPSPSGAGAGSTVMS